MATKAEVRNRALEDLGVIAIGATPQEQDTTRVEASYDEVYADLKDEGLATWASTAAVPDAVTPHMAALVAFSCVDAYGTSPARYQRLQLRSAQAKREIRKIVTPSYESLEDPADY